jgi:DNA invertase Pin-like site-specific DNA recombinase
MPGAVIGYGCSLYGETDRHTQIAALTNAGCVVVYFDSLSKRRPERPELERCDAELRPGDTLMVHRLDRLGNSVPLLFRIFRDLHKRDIWLTSLTEPWVPAQGTAMAEAFRVIISGVFAFEDGAMKAYTKSGLRRSADKGVKFGRPSIAERNQRDVILLLESGKSVAEVVQITGLGRSSVYRIKDKALAKAAAEARSARYFNNISVLAKIEKK